MKVLYIFTNYKLTYEYEKSLHALNGSFEL